VQIEADKTEKWTKGAASRLVSCNASICDLESQQRVSQRPGDGCTASHRQPGLLLVTELDPGSLRL
jgi:hypothetical protein